MKINETILKNSVNNFQVLFLIQWLINFIATTTTTNMKNKAILIENIHFKNINRLYGREIFRKLKGNMI